MAYTLLLPHRTSSNEQYGGIPVISPDYPKSRLNAVIKTFAGAGGVSAPSPQLTVSAAASLLGSWLLVLHYICIFTI